MKKLTPEESAEIRSNGCVFKGKKYEVGIIEIADSENEDVILERLVYRKRLSRNAFSRAYSVVEQDVITALEIIIADVSIPGYTTEGFKDPENWELFMAVNPFMTDLLTQKKRIHLN